MLFSLLNEKPTFFVKVGFFVALTFCPEHTIINLSNKFIRQLQPRRKLFERNLIYEIDLYLPLLRSEIV